MKESNEQMTKAYPILVETEAERKQETDSLYGNRADVLLLLSRTISSVGRFLPPDFGGWACAQRGGKLDRVLWAVISP